MHGGQTRDRDRVQKRENIGREELVKEHADKAVPEEPEGLRALKILPMETLEGLNSRQSAPVNRLYVPNSNRTQDTADAIAKESN